MTVSVRLLAWYDQKARDLPWRTTKDAYKIWVSEVMLQQTRVEAVKEYYERWIERFPTPEILAKASEQEVLQQWQGLGYYTRARHLLSGAREVCATYGGQLPDDEKAVAALPGVGEYTTGAILSIAYNRPIPAVDGNVLRIFSRLFCISDDVTKQATKKTVSGLVQQHISNERPGDFNQALMDLGATLCVPRYPRCQQCPLNGLCEAYAREVQDILPVRTPKKEPLLIHLAAGLVERQGNYLVCQRPESGLLAGMWEFPTVELQQDIAVGEQLGYWLQAQYKQIVTVGKPAFHYVHKFSHRHWDITFYQCDWQAGEMVPKQSRWINQQERSEIPWAGPHRKVAAAVTKIGVVPILPEESST